MANTYTLISSVTVGAGGAASMTFSSIPQTYTDLVIKVSGRNADTGGGNARLRFNSDTTSGNYAYRSLYTSNGTSAASGSSTTAAFAGYVVTDDTGWTANTFGNGEAYIPNYTSSNQKSVSNDGVAENNGTAASLDINAGKWTGTAAITQIDLISSNGNFQQYTTAYLYGIKNS